MIKYRLTCKDCNNAFDSWFASSKEYEKLKKLKFLNCYYCNSVKVVKTLMAPSVLNLKDKKYYKIKNKIKEYQKFIKKNFKYVGDNFAHEARSLHYNNKKKSENIYGKATADEILELKDEGIDADLVPWVKDNDN